VNRSRRMIAITVELAAGPVNGSCDCRH